ncbi:3-hydroxypropionate dehydrogenase [hydrothermal vent metagenome]|uniref:3-hydroxypropionate dehydrogenase n=1 Tax=hydrothermal vent metagenome TaxID=652676 RepID=A0A3B0TSF1_9ZZZZ
MSKPVILVTGATSGFGLATARKFAQNGWKVIATGRRLERLDELADEFEKGVVLALEMDLMELEDIKKAIASIPENFQPVKCLFNNGGLALGSKPVPEARFEDWRQMVETNIMGLIHMSQLMVPYLKEAGRGASIINVGSIAGRFPYPGGNVYGATKAFVRQFSYELRCDLAGSDIRVTSFEPGMAKTEFMKVRTYGDDEANENLYKGVEPILPEDVADIIWFLANMPAHLNVNSFELMPLAQVPAIPTILRKK